MNGALNITLCGGGKLTHARAACSARKGYRVHVYTRRPDVLLLELCAHYFDDDERKVSLASFSNFSGIIESRYFKEDIAWGQNPSANMRDLLGKKHLRRVL